ncbi:MAG: putative lipid II flippase FtsW [Candidatus Nealsonbacteria bacterium]
MKRPDYLLISTVFFLLVIGIIVLMSVSAAIAQDKFNSPSFYLLRHIGFGLLPGVLLGFVAYKFSLERLKKMAPLLLALNLVLMVLVFLPVIGLTLGGASSWINLGKITFQPSEILKLTFILYLASWLTGRMEKDKKETIKTLTAFVVILVLIAFLLILQPDVGTLGILILIAITMYFLARTPLKHTFFIVFGVLSSLGLVILVAPYRLNRLLTFIKPDIEPLGIGYQIKQALIAVGSGGILGRGLGMSVQRFGFLPQPMADSIFAAFSEETGFVGALTLLILFTVFTWLGFSVAKKAKDNFQKLTAIGITTWLMLQALINIGSMIRLVPLTGVPLPFISYGGSALLSELLAVGILLNISKNNAS